MELGTVRADGKVYSNAYDGKPRWLEKRVCENKDCEKEFLAASHRKSRFCSPICQTNASRVQITFICDTCGIKFTRSPSNKNKSKHGFYFCSRVCKENAQSLKGHIPAIRPPHYGNSNGITTYRERAFKKYGIICSRCKYVGDDRMLDVHHLDGNRQNNQIINLEVLCVWCHALETRKNWPHYNK